MPSPERRPHTLQELAEIHRAAQERLGLFGAIETLDEWRGVNLNRPSTNGHWFASLLARVFGLRALSRRLAMSYYNLNRAVGAERAFPDPDGSDLYGKSVPISKLYEDFDHILRQVIDTTALSVNSPDPAPGAGSQAPTEAPDGNDPGKEVDALDARQEKFEERLDAALDELDRSFKELKHDFPEAEVVEVEPHEWPDPNDDDFEKEFRDLLDEQLDALDKEIAELEQQEATDSAEMRDHIDRLGDAKAYTVAGITDAAVVTRSRDVLAELGLGDRLVKGWMRVTGPSPCAFCAMLASRGPVYNTAKTAGLASLNQYHPNCHCHVIPVFKTVPVLSARDQFFYDAWRDKKTWEWQRPNANKRVLEQDSLNQWRRWLTHAYQTGQVPDAGVFGPARG